MLGTMTKIDIGVNKVSFNKAVLFVPYTLIMNPEKARKSEIGHVFTENPYFFDGDSKELDNILIMFLMFEKIKKETSFWFPYLEIVTEMQIGFDWQEEELAEL